MFEAVLKRLMLLALGLYRTIGTTHLGGACRFEPSCSEYALEAIQTHPPLKALNLTIRRIGRCRPGGPWGYDPVPPCSDCDRNGKAI